MPNTFTGDDWLTGLHTGAQLGQIMSANQREQEKIARLAEQTKFANDILQRKQALDEAEAARAATQFQQGQDFRRLLGASLAGGGDFTALTPGEQAGVHEQQIGDLIPQAPPAYIPFLEKYQAGLQQRQKDEQSALYASTLGQGLKNGIPVAKAVGEALMAAPGSLQASRVGDEGVLIKSPEVMTLGLKTFYGQLGARHHERILNDAFPNGIDPEALDRASIKEAGQVAQRLKTAPQKNADDYASWLRITHPDMDQSEIESESKRYVAGGASAVNAPQFLLKEINSGDKVVQGLDQTFNAISSFNKKYGAGAFDQFVGPVEGRIAALERKFGKLNQKDKDDVTAIMSGIEQIKTEYRHTNFGAQLTGNEEAIFKRIVDNPDANSFLPSVMAFRDTTRRLISNSIGVYKDAPNIPPMLRGRYAGGGGATAQGGGAAAVAPVRVASQAEYDAVPSGGLYIDDSGQTKRKK